MTVDEKVVVVSKAYALFGVEANVNAENYRSEATRLMATMEQALQGTAHLSSRGRLLKLRMLAVRASFKKAGV